MKPNATLRVLALFIALGAVAASLGACGGGSSSSGGGSSAPEFIAVAADNLFPLDANTRRIYTSSDSAGTFSERVTGTQAVAGGTGTVVSTIDSTDGSEDVSVYIVDSGGVRVFAAAGAVALDRAFDGVEVLRWPMKAGDHYLQIDKSLDSGEDFDGDGRNDTIAVRSEVTVVARESVSVTAGTFPESLHQRQAVRVTVQPSGGGASVVVNFTVDEWYVPNLGLVKQTVLTTPAGGVPSISTETLSAYRVGARSSDNTAPTVASVTPESAAVRGTATSVSAQFSKAMDPASFATTGSFTVVDSAGARIAGTVQVQGQTAHFVAAQSWASGTYTATVSTAAQDVLGNALVAPRSWAFTVDATAPGVVSLTPASDAVDVDIATSVVLVFSEPPDPTTVNAANVRLSSSNGPVPLALSVDGSRITLTPIAALERDQFYTLSVSGVTDAVGNPLAQALISRFLTNQGRFAFKQSLFPDWLVNTMAIGDVNNDGIPDVLAAGQTTMVASEQGLLLRAGLPDGTLAAETRLDLGALAGCQLGSLAIGDVNDDGRPDVVVGGLNCGTLVLAQTATGTLVTSQYMAQAFGDKLRIVDVDGDGRLDLVMSVAFRNQVEVWRQGIGGLLELNSSNDLGGSWVKDFKVGDIDGDGRIDIVAAISGGLGQDVAVMRQTADGGFAAPEILSTENVWGARAVALGDLNGDGRIDIVATTGGNSPTYLAVYYQAAGGTLGPLTRVPSFDIPFAVQVADIDGDGRADIVVSHEGWAAVGVYLQQPGGTLADEERFRAPSSSNGINSMVVGDINRDGLPDILIAGDWLRQRQQVAGASGQRLRPAAQNLRLRGGLLRR